MLYKYRPLATINPPASNMPQLDFREALSTPDEKLFSAPVSNAAIPVARPVATDLSRGIGFTRSTWANIVFVAIASVGGLVCAFYFFNGGELLRAAASWPSEYLYPRPLFDDKLDISQPNPVDRYASDSSSSSTADSKNRDNQETGDQNFLASNTAPTINTTNPGPVPGPGGPGSDPVPPDPIVIGPPPPPIPPTPTSLIDRITNRADAVASRADTLTQSLMQDPTGTASSTVTSAPDKVKKTAKKAPTVARRKISSTQQKVTATANSTLQKMQQTTSQTPLSQMGAGAAAAQPVNQTMSTGGMGGMGGLGGVGAGAGTGAGATGTAGGGVGGTVGSLGGGLNGGGLGGTISGIGGTVGGVGGGLGGGLVGGHH